MIHMKLYTTIRLQQNMLAVLQSSHLDFFDMRIWVPAQKRWHVAKQSLNILTAPTSKRNPGQPRARSPCARVTLWRCR